MVAEQRLVSERFSATVRSENQAIHTKNVATTLKHTMTKALGKIKTYLKL